MEEKLNYYQIPRDQWREFNKEEIIPLTAEQLQEIKSLNDRIALKDVSEVYLPLVYWLGKEVQIHQELQTKKAQFLGIPNKKVPFILGIAGSVAVGKSTTARLLQILLQKVNPTQKVDLITTDGFLMPTAVLKEKNLLQRKGFPESYDMEKLINFINNVKNGLAAKSPVYSHSAYDIIPDMYDEVINPDILIVEGINVLQLPANQQIYVSDFFDFSVYVDAKEEIIETWYLERFKMLMELAADDPTNYYFEQAQENLADSLAMAQKIWANVNRKNLREFILPTKNRADLIIHKSANHKITELLLRKY